MSIKFRSQDTEHVKDLSGKSYTHKRFQDRFQTHAEVKNPREDASDASFCLDNKCTDFIKIPLARKKRRSIFDLDQTISKLERIPLRTSLSSWRNRLIPVWKFQMWLWRKWRSKS
jgi:hypothetical protein